MKRACNAGSYVKVLCRLDVVSGRWRRDPLLDRAEDRCTIAIRHVDADHIAVLQERRARLAIAQRFDRALLGETGRALAGVFIGDGARADDGAGGERARLRRVRDELRETELHVDAAFGFTKPR